MVGAIVGAASQLPWATLIEYAPGIINGAGKLLASLRGSRSSIAIEAADELSSGTLPDPRKIAAALKDVEESLVTLNGQMVEAGTLIGELASSNAALGRELARQQRWLVGLSAAWLLSIGLGVVALLA